MEPISSNRHLSILLAILAVVAVAGYSANIQHGGEPNRVVLYVSVIVAQLFLVRYVKAGLRGTTLRDLIGRATLLEVAVGAIFWIMFHYASIAASQLLGGVDNHAGGIVPRSTFEIVLWIALSIVAGTCEEIVYRGYLQRRLPIGVISQAIVFGISHGYQGAKSVIHIAILGLMFGALARWRKSLVPGMIAHAWTDIVGGIWP